MNLEPSEEGTKRPNYHDFEVMFLPEPKSYVSWKIIKGV